MTTQKLGVLCEEDGMHVQKANFRKAKAFVRVRKAVAFARFVQQHACPCCGFEEVAAAFEAVFAARREAKAVR
jgi:hypothetical protein